MNKIDDRMVFDLSDRRVNWRRFCPGLPAVEVARKETNPRLWMRATDLYGDAEFYVAGYSTLDLSVWIPYLGQDPSELTSRNYRRHTEPLFLGLVVRHFDRSMFWMEVGERHLGYEGPGALVLTVDRSWKMKSAGEVMAGFKDYTFWAGSHPSFYC